jgi:hypothetical protein
MTEGQPTQPEANRRREDWALGNYFRLESEWKWELEAIVGRAVSVEPSVPGENSDVRVRHEGKLLWARG